MQNMSKVQQGQSFIDKTLELTGSVENLLEMAILNNVSITDDVAIGVEIIGSGVVKNGIVEDLKSFPPATKVTSKILEDIPLDLGIGEMIIESTFIII